MTFTKASFQARDEAIAIRASGDVKDLLRQAAKRERRSVAPMVELLEIACGTVAKVY